MALAVAIHIKPIQYTEGVAYDIFDEFLHPINYDQISFDSPDAENIYVYVNTIFHVAELSPECAIMTLAFLERLIKEQNVLLNAKTWRRTLMSIIILSSKVWEEQAVWNVDFLEHFPRVEIADLNALEKHLLQLLKWNVGLNGSLYAKYYFDLRQLSELDEEHFPLSQLTDRDLARLEDNITFDPNKPSADRLSKSKSFAPEIGGAKGRKIILN